MVVDALEDGHDRRAGECGGGSDWIGTPRGGDRAPVEVEPRDPTHHLGGRDVHGSRQTLQRGRQALEAPWGEEQGPHLVGGSQQLLDGEVALDDEHPPLVLDPAPKGGVCQSDVVGDAGIVGIGDRDGAAHGPTVWRLPETVWRCGAHRPGRLTTVVPMATKQPTGRTTGAFAWVRTHRAPVAIAGAALAVVIVVIVIVAVSSGGGSGVSVPPGTYVGSAPLTTGYRVTGKVQVRSAASITLSITRVDFKSGEARNAVLAPGQVVEFDRPAQGLVAIARSGRRVSDASKLHVGDVATLVGQFTSVAVPPAPAHDGYAFFAVEASSR